MANKHPADVLADVTKRGSTLSALAKLAKLPPGTLSHSLRRCIPRANKAIATFLGVPTHSLWPEWFDRNGQLLPGRSKRPETSRNPDSKNRQNVQALADKRSAA